MKRRQQLCLTAVACAGVSPWPVFAQTQPVTADEFNKAMAAGNAVPGRLIKEVRPSYPGIAREQQVDGDVRMNVTLAVDGTVQNIKVTHGLPQLIKAATHAVNQWRYTPARVNGVAVPVNSEIIVQFVFGPNGDQFNAPAIQSAAIALPKPVAPPAPAGVLRISGQVMNGRLESRTEPIYPVDAIPLDAQGQVVLLATIDKTGKVSDVQAVSGPLRFRDAALKAVKQWIYRPYETEDGPAVVQSTVILNFAPPHAVGLPQP